MQKLKNYWQKKECDAIIERYKNDVVFYDGMPFERLYEILRLNGGFGEAEANIIIASLIKCGAKII